MNEVQLREVRIDDVGPVSQIYADEVVSGVATFAYSAPSTDEWLQDIDESIAAKRPFLVAVKDDRVIGYARVTPFSSREGYRRTVENSIYVDKSSRGMGVGGLLLSKLVVNCESCGYRTIISKINGGPTGEVSRRLHRSYGFVQCGVIVDVAAKFGVSFDIVIMQRLLGEK